jgi:hypothetical protein
VYFSPVVTTDKVEPPEEADSLEGTVGIVGVPTRSE